MSMSRAMVDWIANYDSQRSLGSRWRARRIAPLLEMIELICEKKGSVSIVDIGGTERYWGIVSSQYLCSNNVTITIVNLPGTKMPEDHGPFRFIEADACNLSELDDLAFDIAHSNSVVEHVGDWGRMVMFAKELKRVSRAYFVQTPNYWFPMEPHCMTPFFHWLPKPTRLWLVQHFQLGNWKKATSTDQAVRVVEGVRLLNKEMFQSLFQEASIVTERLFLLPKSLIAIRN